MGACLNNLYHSCCTMFHIAQCSPHICVFLHWEFGLKTNSSNLCHTYLVSVQANHHCYIWYGDKDLWKYNRLISFTFPLHYNLPKSIYFLLMLCFTHYLHVYFLLTSPSIRGCLKFITHTIRGRPNLCHLP